MKTTQLLLSPFRGTLLLLTCATGALHAAPPQTPSAASATSKAVESKAAEPPAAPAPENPWKFTLAMPGWLAATSGTIGLDGVNSHIYMGADTLIKHLDMAASLSAEARKGRFGVYGDLLYVKASDAIFSNGLIGKADLHLDQWLTNFEVNYRILEGQKGYVDLRAGVRYTDIYNSIITNANDSAIRDASRKLVDDVSDKVRDRLNDVNLKGHLQGVLGDRIRARIGDGLGRGTQTDRPTLAAAPLLGDRGAVVDTLVRRSVNDRLDDLAAALRARAQAATDAARAAAQSRVDALKSRIESDITKSLKNKLGTSASLNERWLDPYVGLGARFNITKAIYLSGKADIGGFGVGSEITWQGSAALGCQLSRSIFVEAGYRYLYTDYDHGGFVYDVTQSGAQITAGITF